MEEVGLVGGALCWALATCACNCSLGSGVDEVSMAASAAGAILTFEGYLVCPCMPLSTSDIL